ncbi:MAG: AMP-binding protein [Gemmatimonadaceae bacterium]
MIPWPQFPRYTDPLRHWSRLAPGRLALVVRGRGSRQTYAELDASADMWADELRRRGIGKGDRVAVIAGNRREIPELFFACGRLGAAMVPLNWRLAGAELTAILNHARPAIVIGEARFLALVSESEALVLREWMDIEADAPSTARASSHGSNTEESQGTVSSEHVPDVEVGPDDPALILYTSGSTGLPKGVIIPHRQILFNAVATATAWELGPSDIAPVATPFFHTGGLNVFATPIWHRGGTVVLFDQFNPAGFMEGVAEENCTVALTVPTQLVMMRDSARWGIELPALRYFISGGAPCPPSLSAEVRAAGYTLREGYGLTECGPNCFAISDDESIRNPGSVGRPVPFLEMRLVTNDGREAGTDEPGELLLRGPQMFGGYLHDPERTAEAVTDGWLHTGDLASRNAAGLYSICGRRKEMYISGGENVFPAGPAPPSRDCRTARPGAAAPAAAPRKRWGQGRSR